GRQLRTAAQAWSEPGGFGGRRVAEIGNVLALRGRCRADRAAIDPGAGDGSEEQAVEACIAAQPGLLVDLRIEWGSGGEGGRGCGHGRRLAPDPGLDWPDSDINAAGDIPQDLSVG